MRSHKFTAFKVMILACVATLLPCYKSAFGQIPPLSPRLFIHGGAGMSEEQDERLLEMGGGKSCKLVVIPTAKDPDNISIEKIADIWTRAGFPKPTVLHTTEKRVADDPDFCKPLADATLIWISGGSQRRLSDAYSGTLFEKKLIEYSRRGGVVGGSSAGAAIQSAVMIQGGKQEPEMGEGFDLFPGAIVDQHFLARSRLNRMIAAVQQNPELIGYGIDEGTALIVEGDWLEVIGKSYVLQIRSVDGQIKMESLKPGKPQRWTNPNK